MKIGIDSYSYHRYFGEVYKSQRNPIVVWSLNDFFNHININHTDIEAVSLETCFINIKEKNNMPRILKDINYDVIFAWGHPNGFMEINTDHTTSEIIDYIKLTNAIGQSVLRIVASSIAYYHKPHQPQINTAIRNICKIIDIAKDYDVKLALENHGDFHINEMLTILEKVNSDYLGITFDTGNSLRLHEDCVPSIKEYGEKIFLIHAKDVMPEKDISTAELANLNCVAAGDGIVDFKNIFLELNKNQYIGMVLIEISRLHSSLDNVEETQIINKGIKYLKNLRGEFYV